MHHADGVRVRQRAGHLARQPDGLRQRERPLALEPPAQRLARDVRHGIPRAAGGPARVEHREDVRVLQRRGHADLAVEPLGAGVAGDDRQDHLERHRPRVLEVAGQVDHGHAAPAELALEQVAVAERVYEGRELGWRGRGGGGEGHLGISFGRAVGASADPFVR
jgi:hypothetical protein